MTDLTGRGEHALPEVGHDMARLLISHPILGDISILGPTSDSIRQQLEQKYKHRSGVVGYHVSGNMIASTCV